MNELLDVKNLHAMINATVNRVEIDDATKRELERDTTHQLITAGTDSVGTAVNVSGRITNDKLNNMESKIEYCARGNEEKIQSKTATGGPEIILSQKIHQSV